MRRRQPVNPSGTREYQIINDFNKGYNTTTYDGALRDGTFKDMINMDIKEEGVVSKRKGMESLGLLNLFSVLKGYNGSSFQIKSNQVVDYGGESDPYSMPLFITSQSGTDANLLISDFLDVTGRVLYFNIDDPYDLLDWSNDDFKNIDTRYPNWRFAADSSIFNPVYTTEIQGIFANEYSSVVTPGGGYAPRAMYSFFKYVSIKLNLVFSERRDPDTTALMGYKATINVSLTQYKGTTGADYAMSHELYQQGYINLVKYNDKQYFTTGYELFQINADKTLTKVSATPYKPNAIELSYVGFNILATNPLTWYDSGSGTADAIKGVFMTMNGEPIQKIPSVYTTSTNNKAFQINVLTTGSGTLAKPKYRLDNGEVSTSLNPYTEMVGTYSGNVFTCTDFNLEGKYEIMIEKGSAPKYIGFYEASPTQEKNIGKVADIKNLIKSSLYCKVINNQLVLYGGHGYIFFSEFSNFSYFPNYNYVYAVDTSDDEVVSINYFRQFYTVFTKKKLKRLSGNFPFQGEGQGLFPLNDFIGCINPNTIKQVQNYLYFMANEGLFRLKQGYTGEGTENVDQIDISIKGDYNPKDITRAITKDNNYIMYLSDRVISYNYIMDAFFKYKYTYPKSSIWEDGLALHNVRIFTTVFDSNGSTLIGVLTNDTSYENPLYTFGRLDILKLDADVYTDNGESYPSGVRLPKLFFDTPTNRKKFKTCMVKTRNEGSGNIPLYVDVKVDDITVVSPDDYVIRVDEDDDYIYYERTQNPNENINLKEGAVLGDITLGEQSLGVARTQDIKINVDNQGKCISMSIFDNYPNADGSVIGTNDEPFSISDIGFMFKLKKPKED